MNNVSVFLASYGERAFLFQEVKFACIGVFFVTGFEALGEDESCRLRSPKSVEEDELLAQSKP